MGDTINLTGKIPGGATQEEAIASIKKQIASGSLLAPMIAKSPTSLPPYGQGFTEIVWAKERVAIANKNVDAKEKSMASSREPEHPNWPAADQESQFQDMFCQKALDRLGERGAAIFTDPNAGTTSPAHDWIIRSKDCGELGSFGKELLIKLSEGLKGAETMQLYHTYIVDLKNHAIYPYGPILAKSKNLARDQALTYLVSAATVPDFEDVKVFDGEIEHYHIAVVEIVGGIPDKITNE